MWLEWRAYKNTKMNNHCLNDLFKNFQYHKGTFNQYLKDGLYLEVEPYSKELNEHLEDDIYKDEKETIELRNIYIKLHNEELKEFYSGLLDDITNYIIQQQGQHLPKDFDINKIHIKIDTLEVIRDNYQAPKSLQFSSDTFDNFFYLYSTSTHSTWVRCNTKKEREDIETELIKKFDDAIRTFKFKLLLCYYNEINTYQTNIDRKLKQIIDELEIKSTPLKGKCKKCPPLDGFWRYVWQQHIKKLLP